MGYDLHITRAEWWIRSAEHPISRQEWRTVADAWPGMVTDGRYDSGGGPVPLYALPTDGAYPVVMYWAEGRVTTRMLRDTDTAELARLAEALGARLVGDDGECYLPDGSVLGGLVGEGPVQPDRPLYVHEVAAAWRSLLSWEDCVDEGSTMAQALTVFRAIAVREVVTWDVPDADMLYCGFHVDTFYARQTLVVTLLRQFAVPDEFGGDVVRVACDVRFPPLPDLRFFHGWAPAGGPEERRAWLADIDQGPGWEALDRATPSDLTLCGEPLYTTRIWAARSASGLDDRQDDARRPHRIM
jgi:hypothetical protein